MVDFPLIAARTALLNIDMMGFFVDLCPGSTELLSRINGLSRVCRAHEVLVVHTAQVVRADGSNTGVMGEISALVRDGIFNEGSDTVTLHADLDIAEGDIVLNKPKFSAFHGTDLEEMLRYRGIDTLIISGIATNICCETTARDAVQREFRVFFLEDGTAAYDIGDFTAAQAQRATCTALGFAFAQIITTEQIIAKIQA